VGTEAASHSDVNSVAGTTLETQMIVTSSVFVMSWFSGNHSYGEVIKIILFYHFSPIICSPCSSFSSFFLLNSLPFFFLGTGVTDVAIGLRYEKSRNRGRFPAEARYFSLLDCVQTGPETHLAPYSKPKAISPGTKVAGA
jgi:hypothetical protein